jgi:hypothetical protein
LFVAEAPPAFGSERFFYFEDVRRFDALFWDSMRVLYRVTEVERSRKVEFLNRFKEGGFFLIDACSLPLSKSAGKKREIRNSLEDLKIRLSDRVEADTKIVLICKTVYDVCFKVLRGAGFNVINTEPIPHPAFGHAAEFRKNLGRLLS